MIRDIINDCEERMEKAIEVLKREFASVRAGRATPALLDRITIDYYGVDTPIKQVGTITTPEPRLLVVQPWDKNVISQISKAIMQSDLGLNPSSDGNVIRLVIPTLTEERRKELTKMVRKQAEECKVAVRNIRRDGNDMIRELESDSQVSEDDSRRGLDKVQDVTNKYVAKVDEVLAEKAEEIMEV